MSKRLKYFLLGSLIFIVLGFCGFAFRLLGSPDFKIIYEQQFDKKIDKVAFDLYEKDGNVTYYPKIIALKERDDFTIEREYKDERFDDERVFKNVDREISIFSPQGRQIKSISGYKHNFYAGAKLDMSDNGNYFAIEQVVRMEDFYSTLMNLYFSREDIDSMRMFEGIGEDELEDIILKKYEGKYGKLIEPSFSVYNDKGELLWMNDTLLEADYMQKGSSVKISPVDGSILYSYIYFLGYYKIIDVFGNIRKAFPSELDDYSVDGLRMRFSEGRKYTAIGFKKYVKPHRTSYGPGIALLDSNRNLLWKKSLEHDLLSWVAISPKGSYIGVETYSSFVSAKTGYLFDKEGNLVMNLPPAHLLWETLAPFSENEIYFASLEKERLALYDISEKKLVHEKDLPSSILGISVSNDGKCAIVSRRREDLEYYPTGRPSKMRYLYKVFIVDERGNTVWDSDEMEATSTHLLGWDNENLIFAIMDKEKGYIKIVKVSL